MYSYKKKECNRHMYLENRRKRLHMFGKSSFLDLEPSTWIHADSDSRFLTSTGSNSEVFVDVWLFLDKSISEFSMALLKKKCVLMWLRVYNHDLGL